MINNTAGNDDVLHNDDLKPFPVVAIGASAGGLEAVSELMQSLPHNTGMAFVYIQHLDRTYDSALVAILQRATMMKVLEIENGIVIKPNQLFVIPPNTDMQLVGDTFTLSERAKAPAKHSPIDVFFLSLAENKREGAIGIVLSGTATDGALGLKAIKEAGGITFAQDESALFQSMPKTAIGEGIVDSIMSPREMAEELTRLSQNSSMLLRLLPSDGDDNDNDFGEDTTLIEFEDLKKILRLIRNVTGVDFTNYKQNTIKRRIIRRMLLHRFNTLPEYLIYLKQHTSEVNSLYQDLLINVTHFFRDAEVAEYLKKELLPELLKNKSTHNPLRIWVPACATGEEAYSLAIMLCEIMGEGVAYNPFQIFATDLSESAIAKARVGMYTVTDVMQVSKKRLQLFFTKVDGHYRINKRIRDFCVFAPHNILKDPPFSRVDLISCCNLLIYFDTVLQRKVIANFHYALNKKGYLVLGKSETIGSSTKFFTQVDKKVKVYIKKAETASTAIFDINFQPEEVTESILPKRNMKQPIKELTAGENSNIESVVDNILLAQYVPPGVVVNYDLDIVQFRGATGLFLEPSPGKASLHLLKMVRSGLELELRSAAHKVIKSGEPLKVTGLDITHKGNIHHVAFEVIPLIDQVKEKLLLIIFEEVKTPSPADLKASFSKDRRVKQLENELIALREDLRSLVEEQEAANEELQSANEEIVSSNEELQSINEELETSKEELESSNEELLTINQELQVRNDQLSESYDYTEKVIETIREAVLILDSLLLVKSANKAFYRIFNTKVEETEGRLIYEISNGQWNIPRLKELLQEILPRQNQYLGYEITHTFAGIGEKVMLLSVRTILQKSSGRQMILLAIEDITEHRQAERLLQEREEWVRNMANSVPVMLWVAGTDESITFVNNTWLAFTGRSLAEEVGIGWTEGIHGEDIHMVVGTFHSSFKDQKPFTLEYRMKRYDGEYRWILNSAVPTYGAGGKFSGYTGSCTEINDKRVLSEELENRVQERTHELQEANFKLERSNSDLAQFAYVASHDLQEPLRKIITFSTRLKEKFIGQLTETSSEYIEKINHSAERMRNLIDDLLNFSHISKFERKFIKTDLNEVVGEVINDFELLIHERKVLVSIDKLPVLDAIPLQMNQLFNNLLSNALKFSSRKDNPTISIKCRQLTEDDLKKYNQFESHGLYYEITVTDNGIGFSQDFADQIFIIFQRLNDKEDYPGTGIGLTLCRKIVRNHGGEITVKSEEGAGATFYIILPEKQVVRIVDSNAEIDPGEFT